MQVSMCVLVPLLAALGYLETAVILDGVEGDHQFAFRTLIGVVLNFTRISSLYMGQHLLVGAALWSSHL